MGQRVRKACAMGKRAQWLGKDGNENADGMACAMERNGSAYGNNFGCGKMRGFVFSIDATMGMFLILVMLATALFLSLQAQDDPYGKLQMSRIARDAMNSMDERGILGGNFTVINNSLNATIPQSLGANLLVDAYYYDNGSTVYINSTQYGLAVPSDEDTYSIRHEFATVQNGLMINYSIARLTIWQQ